MGRPLMRAGGPKGIDGGVAHWPVLLSESVTGLRCAAGWTVCGRDGGVSAGTRRPF
jgi:hypothetical protein